jgi:hypothetical protein
MIVGRDQKKNSAAVEGPPVVDARVPWPAGRARRTSGTRRSRPMTQGGPDTDEFIDDRERDRSRRPDKLI